ncbi:hypothetical protein QMT40_000134 [Parvibaculaceae bacterium PLY_AMNH_Bact1]|nr:hypothetical protein QMT40_000134 [Parvibaculaceae bacterium PLY_AMNH_Bact1]
MLVALAAVFLSSCDESYTQDDVAFKLAAWISDLPPEDYIPPEMQVLCADDAGRQISRIYNVEGYALAPRLDLHSVEEIAKGNVQSSGYPGGCFSCLPELVEFGFDYIEAAYQSANDRRNMALSKRGQVPEYHFRDQYVDKTGLYRYSLQARSTAGEKCTAFDAAVKMARSQSFVSTSINVGLTVFWRDYNRLKEDLGDRCVVVTHISEFQAPYVFEQEMRRLTNVPWRLLAGHITTWRERVVNRASGDVVARSTAHRYLVHGGGARFHRRGACGSSNLPRLHTFLFSGTEGIVSQ